MTKAEDIRSQKTKAVVQVSDDAPPAPRRRGRPRKNRGGEPEAALLQAQSVIDGNAVPSPAKPDAREEAPRRDRPSAWKAARHAAPDSLRRLGERWLEMLLAGRGLSSMTVDSYRQDISVLADFVDESLGDGLTGRAALARLDDEQLLLFIVSSSSFAPASAAPAINALHKSADVFLSLI